MLADGHADPLSQHLSGIPGPRIECLVGHDLETLVLHLANVKWDRKVQVVKKRPLSELTFHPCIIVFRVVHLDLLQHGLFELFPDLRHEQNILIDLVAIILS